MQKRQSRPRPEPGPTTPPEFSSIWMKLQLWTVSNWIPLGKLGEIQTSSRFHFLTQNAYIICQSLELLAPLVCFCKGFVCFCKGCKSLQSREKRGVRNIQACNRVDSCTMMTLWPCVTLKATICREIPENGLSIILPQASAHHFQLHKNMKQNHFVEELWESQKSSEKVKAT